MFRGLPYFNHSAVLSFWTAGKLFFGKFINYNIKIYTRWFTWKALNGFITNKCVKFADYWREFFLLLNSVSVESSFNGVVLIWNCFFRVDAAKLSSITSLLFGVSVVLITLFSDVLQFFIEMVDKLFESSSVFLIMIIIIFYVKQYHFLLDYWHIYTRGFHH